MNQLSKNRKTKKFCLVLAVLVVLSCVLCACGIGNTNATQDTTVQEDTVPPINPTSQDPITTETQTTPQEELPSQTEPVSQKQPSPQGNIMPSIKEGSYLINNLPLSSGKSQKEIINTAKTVIFQDSVDIGKRFSKNKTENFYTYADDHVILRTTFDKNDNIDRFMYLSCGDVIRFEYIFTNITTSSTVSVDDVIKDVESVFGELKDVAAFKSFIKDNSALIGTEGFDGVSESFKTASGISVAVSVGSFGDPVYSVEAEYMMKM